MSGCGVPSAVRLLLREPPAVADQAVGRIELSFVEDLAFADLRAPHDHLQHAVIRR